ncbi:MAG: hypothetical protein Q3959_00850 [Limosilactobacillus sp.]|uniref:DUF4870 domain-containing protein n=1 Tax=Limosilactobacillus sp. TaxID=2773925 RepID=UPI0027039605|nr:hypothetical protein [Limosilactobacillus sp.]
MNNSFSTRIVNALSYFSIFFMPVLFPLIVWVVAKNTDCDHSIKTNAMKAFWSQIFPALYFIFAILIISLSLTSRLTGILFGILLTFALLAALLLFIYNVAMGVKMLIGRE